MQNPEAPGLDNWAGEILAQPRMKELFNNLGIMKSIMKAIVRDLVDLEFLMSR